MYVPMLRLPHIPLANRYFKDDRCCNHRHLRPLATGCPLHALVLDLLAANDKVVATTATNKDSKDQTRRRRTFLAKNAWYVVLIHVRDDRS